MKCAAQMITGWIIYLDLTLKKSKFNIVCFTFFGNNDPSDVAFKASMLMAYFRFRYLETCYS